jgi:polyisoprenoid-binding protein YceI
MRFAKSLVYSLAVLALPLAADAATYTVNKSHSSAGFRIRHWVSNVEGRFDAVDGAIQFDAKNPALSSVEFTADAKSINTGQERRDADLRSANFFDVERCPALTFKSSKVVARDASHFDVSGDLTMRCVTQAITVPVEFLGTQPMGGGKEKAGFESTFTVNRKDFGIVWNQTLDQGGTMLGDEVKITIAVEADLQAPAQ